MRERELRAADCIVVFVGEGASRATTSDPDDENPDDENPDDEDFPF